jgi:DNA-binding LacI/PurR family transcriptional regulator
MPLQKALQSRQLGQMPPLAGVFDLAYQPSEGPLWQDIPEIPHVGLYGFSADRTHADTVTYDDVGGGILATQHLLHMGHRRIAYLGVHAVDAAANDEDWRYVVWSAEREQGWRETMIEAGEYSPDLAFHPVKNPQLYFHWTEQTFEAANHLLRRPDVTAVVSANDTIAAILFEAARHSGLPEARWPAAVGFDDTPDSDEHVLTSLRRPGEEIGRTAADLLWERRHGLLSGPPQHRRVPMRLIPRLTSRMDWSQSTGHAALTTPHVRRESVKRESVKKSGTVKKPTQADVSIVSGV